jgi:tetratricopeptide (TPR) repeat protein
MRKVVRVFGVAVLAMVMLVAGGIGVLRGGNQQATPSARLAGPALASQPVIEAGSVSTLISTLQARLRVVPEDWRSHADLGLAYVQQARVTADPSYYPKAEGVLSRSLQLKGTDNVGALMGMAVLAAARHDFAAALDWGRRAVRANPDSADARAVVGDALVELGRYDQAFRTFQRMIDLRPQMSTYARVSYAWELRGSFKGALEAMQLALHAAGSPTDAAWASNQLGDLYWDRGKLTEAEEWYRRAVAADPSFVRPLAGLANVAAARGQTESAIHTLTAVAQRNPSPEFVIALGDLYTVTDRPEQAARQYSLVGAEERLLRAAGVNPDLEIALFDADHRIEPDKGLAAARQEWTRRRSIHVADALAWALYANGSHDEALRYADKALRLGTRNALFLFHRGMIQRALGKTREARSDLAAALQINPHFSILWSKRAQEVLASLGGVP